MDSFTQGYIEAALWSTTDDQGNALDERFGIADLDPMTLAQMEADCADFQAANETLLLRAYRRPGFGGEASAGMDFWLTRNRHGAGFWDRGLGPLGRHLTQRAHAYGEAYLLVCVRPDGTEFLA